MPTLNTPYQFGRHLGALPLNEALNDEIQRMHAKGWDTCMAHEYRAMLDQKVEPDAWRLVS